ncbi:ribbon-helix-helix domain-containing protein [Azospirillum canadense]|uniref:ribbon-helix-helix domain-containing protein n=1 Tax=Azospirillum canadense TaxID=403962 RepID=UPI0022273EDA|nr:ribbon-helix-helix domain-containing protein [Azospirillum canadense]MCW2240391.1 putative DNA-binding ribbon-helix-helix protein [Azospirillum canadense]
MTIRIDLEESALHSRRLRVPGRETSVRLEQGLWDAYDAVCRATGCPRNALASRIEARRDRALGLTNAVRLFIVEYWRAACDDRDAEPMTVLDRALTAISPKATGAVEAAVMRMRDRLAPEMTPRRIALVLELSRDHTDVVTLAAAARSQWGRLAPWEPRSDVLAGQALRDLLHIVVTPDSALQCRPH